MWQQPDQLQLEDPLPRRLIPMSLKLVVAVRWGPQFLLVWFSSSWVSQASTSHGGLGVVGPLHGICLPRSEKQKLSGFLKAPAWKFTSCQLKGAAGSGQTQGKGTHDTGHERREWPLGGALPQTKKRWSSHLSKRFKSLKHHGLF